MFFSYFGIKSKLNVIVFQPLYVSRGLSLGLKSIFSLILHNEYVQYSHAQVGSSDL